MSVLSVEQLSSRLESYILSSSEFRGEHTFTVESSKIVEIFTILKNELGFLYLVDITAVDFLGIKSPRFEMVYQLHRFGEDYEDNLRIRIKTTIPDESSSIDSVTPV